MDCKQRHQAPSTSLPVTLLTEMQKPNKPMIDIQASLQILQSDVTFVIHARRIKFGRSRDGLQAESWEAGQRGEAMTYSDGFTGSALVVHNAQCRSDPEGCEEEQSHGGTPDKLHSSEKLRNNVIAELALSQRKIWLLSVSVSFSLSRLSNLCDECCLPAHDYVWMKLGQRMKGWMNHCHLPSCFRG